jgi:predicted nucleic acid-binding protein
VLVIDASVCIELLLADGTPEELQGRDLAAPPLLWSETTSGLRELAFRELVTPHAAANALERLPRLGIERQVPQQLYRDASALASSLGWAKTYFPIAPQAISETDPAAGSGVN